MPENKKLLTDQSNNPLFSMKLVEILEHLATTH